MIVNPRIIFNDLYYVHLNPGGKAGVIVPEGIIFQSGTAYKLLRKMLVSKEWIATTEIAQKILNTSKP